MQTAVFAPPADAFVLASSEEPGAAHYYIEPVVRAGRAVLFPIYKGTYERRGPPADQSTSRDRSIQSFRDFGRSLDYLEARADIDRTKLAFYGVSAGASTGQIFIALDSRPKVSILIAPGLNVSPIPGNSTRSTSRREYACRR